MSIKSLGYRSDLILASFEGEIIDRGDYTVVKSPLNPRHFWGNYLLFSQAPILGDYSKWGEVFKKEFTDPRVAHVALGWDSPQGEIGNISEFTAQGFELEKGIVLTAQTVEMPAKNNSKIMVKPLEKDEDWESAIRINVEAGLPWLSRAERETFYRAHFVKYQKMVDKKLGHFFGAYLDGRLVGALGVFKEAAVGRFQLVCTDPGFQRRGIAGTLVYYASRFALKHMGLRLLVIVATEDSYAAKVYESVGFVPTEKMYGLCCFDKSKYS